MATYTSTQNGNWNDSATWGGGGSPSSNDDVVNVDHEVVFNLGDSSVIFGNITVGDGGLLVLPSTSDSTLKLNDTAKLLVDTGGELRTGTTSTIASVDANYVCKILWNQGSTARTALEVRVGGILNLRGDSAYYGARTKYLKADWTTGQTFYLIGDCTSWKSGNHIWIGINNGYNDYLSDSSIYTIDTVGSYDSGNNRTAITIVETAPEITYYYINPTTHWNCKVVNISRNVILADVNYSFDRTFNTYSEYLRTYFYDTEDTVDIRDVLFMNWATVFYYSNKINCDNVACVNNSQVCYRSSNCNFDIDVVYASNGFWNPSTYNNVISGIVAASYYAFRECLQHIISSECLSCYDTFYLCSYCTISSNIINCNNGHNTTTYSVISGSIMSNEHAFRYCDSLIVTSCFVEDNTYTLDNVKNSNLNCQSSYTPVGFYQCTNVILSGKFHSIDETYFEDINHRYSAVIENSYIGGILCRYKAMMNTGNIEYIISSDAEWQTPSSGSTWISKMVPNSNIIEAGNSFVNWLSYSPIAKMVGYTDESSITVTFKIYPVGWAAALNNSNLIINAWYKGSANSGFLSTTQSTAGIYSNDGWRSVSISFSPQPGVFYLELLLKSYEADCYVLVDPIWSVS